jgi:hypothetical protein
MAFANTIAKTPLQVAFKIQGLLQHWTLRARTEEKQQPEILKELQGGLLRWK